MRSLRALHTHVFELAPFKPKLAQHLPISRPVNAAHLSRLFAASGAADSGIHVRTRVQLLNFWSKVLACSVRSHMNMLCAFVVAVFVFVVRWLFGAFVQHPRLCQSTKPFRFQSARCK